MKPIPSRDFEVNLEPILRRSIVWEGDALVDDARPLRDVLPARALVFPVVSTVPRELFTALLAATSSSFAAPTYLSLLERLDDESASDWQLDTDGYDEYSATVGGFPLEQALYAGDGSWVLILTTFAYGILGSTQQGFVDNVCAAAPRFFDTNALIADVRAELENEGHELRDSWFVELLGHIYGPDRARSLLSSERR